MTVTCGLCRCEVILLLGGPYLLSHHSLNWEGSLLGPGLESTLGGLRLNKHGSENSAPETPVRINGVFLHGRELQMK